jgi:hypothetical protein
MDFLTCRALGKLLIELLKTLELDILELTDELDKDEERELEDTELLELESEELEDERELDLEELNEFELDKELD